MLRSTGTRFLIVALLVLLMSIPMLLVSFVVGARQNHARDTIEKLGQEWGGPQVVTGPFLVIPVTATVERTTSQPGGAPKGDGSDQASATVTETVVEMRESVWVLPDRYDLSASFETEVRHRGIFNVPVYQGVLSAKFNFDVDDVEASLLSGEEIHWDLASVDISISNNAALRGEAALEIDGASYDLEPRSRGNESGIGAMVGDPRGKQEFALTLGVNGARSFMATPSGRTTRVEITSDWAHPSFQGAYLPDSSQITDDGFSAAWTIPHLARALPQISRFSSRAMMNQSLAFGFETFEPNNFYQKAYRSAAYSILFIALTFLTVLLVEKRTKKPAHPVQYILIGLAQLTFVLLMVAYAEHIGFLAAYVLSSGATIGLLTLYGWVGLKLKSRTWVLGGVLIVLYAVLYFILDSVDYALLAGSTLAFGALAAAMLLTRNEEWYDVSNGGNNDAAVPTPPTPDGTAANATD
ncbi:cell envelope integrity protein CreD [Celeribacter arenosi]|uniref:Cell envelope integrity protein CreD n=1 Tax=Celeribacter arenosi TaxID=792649 RepID=A0ABP7K245_9RHOB